MRAATLTVMLLAAGAGGCAALFGETETSTVSPRERAEEEAAQALDPAASGFTVDRTGDIVANGNDAAQLQAKLQVAGKRPAVGALVTVTASGHGNIVQQAASTTGVDGIARVRVASTVAETKHVSVVVHVGGVDTQLVADQALTFIPGTPVKLGFEAVPAHAVAGGTFAPGVQVAMQDAFGNVCPLSDDSVDLALQTGGSLRGITHAQAAGGVATFDAACAPLPATAAVLVATAPGLTTAKSPVFAVSVGAQSSFVSDANTIAADSYTAAHLTLTLTDAVGTPLPQIAVTMISPGGIFDVLPAGTVTDANGIATTAVTSSRVHAGSVVAEFPGGTMSVPLTFVTPPPRLVDPNRSTLTANPNSAQADGVAAVGLRTSVVDTIGRPIAGQVVTLSATGRGVTLHPAASGTTDAGGTFVSGASSSRAGTSTITATSGGVAFSVTAQFTPPVCAGTLQFVSSTANAAAGTYGIASADFDGDGHVDLAVSNATDGSITFLRGNGDGSFAVPVTTAVDTGVSGMAAGDLDGDGRPDLVLSSTPQNHLDVLLGSGGGHFGTAQQVPTSTGPAGLLLVDLNRDGHLDVVVASSSGSGGVDVLVGSGSGGLNAPVNYVTATSPWNVCTCDLDGDGWPDIATADYAAHSLSTLGNLGNGGLAAAVAHPVTLKPIWVGCGDFDGDGHVDLVSAANNEGVDVSGVISVLLGNGAGFAAPLTTAVTGTPYSGAVADFNHDGRLDVMVAARAANTALLMSGLGTGHLSAPASYAVGTAPTAAVAADIDGDGRLDAALTNSSSRGGVGILMSRGCVTGH